MPRNIQKNSLIKRLFFISLPLAVLAGVMYAAVIIYIESQSLKEAQLNQIKTQMRQLAKVIATPTWNLDQTFINNYLTQYAQDPHLLCIELRSDANFTEKSPINCEHPDSEHVHLFSEPIIFNNQYIGAVIASFKVELDNKRLKFILLSRIPAALIALLSIFIVVFWVFRRWIISPIESIMESIEASQEDGKYHPVNWESHDEIGTLVKTFNDAQLKQVQHDQMLTSERDKAEQALADLKHTQSQLVESEKMASLGSLVAGISHEINTPLGVARTSASYVEDSVKQLEDAFYKGTLTKNEMKEFIETFNDGIRLMTTNLVRASELMTSFKQVSADQSHDEDRLFNLYEYLQETLYTLKPNLKRYQVSILLDCNEHILIHSFPGALSQIITNLIMNSLMHAYKENDEGTIRIQVKETESNIEITYSDNGAGMNEKTRKKIFDPFFTTKRGKGGTGLGMHIIYNLITHKLKGNIDVESTQGEGTTFRITFPKQST